MNKTPGDEQANAAQQLFAQLRELPDSSLVAYLSARIDELETQLRADPSETPAATPLMALVALVKGEVEQRGIDPLKAVKAYRDGSLTQHQADAYDADQDIGPEHSDAYNDGYESTAETLGAASNPFTGMCEAGDEAACSDADDWDMGAAAARTDDENEDYH